jgi:hypothetical protein
MNGPMNLADKIATAARDTGHAVRSGSRGVEHIYPNPGDVPAPRRGTAGTLLLIPAVLPQSRHTSRHRHRAGPS